MTRVLLFDLDDTLIVEEPAAVAAFRATAELAAGRHSVDAGLLALDARAAARKLWRARAEHEWARRIGMSSWEGLWCRFEGEALPLEGLRSWSPEYRSESWHRALAAQGVVDLALARELGEAFVVQRRARHMLFPDVLPALAALRATHRLGLLTNGAVCLQREKIDACGLTSRFDAIVVSGELGVGKPDPSVFAHILARLGTSPGEAVMVGDSLARDVEGALAAGLSAIWLNRGGEREGSPPSGAIEVAGLDELVLVLQALGQPRGAAAQPQART